MTKILLATGAGPGVINSPMVLAVGATQIASVEAALSALNAAVAASNGGGTKVEYIEAMDTAAEAPVVGAVLVVDGAYYKAQ